MSIITRALKQKAVLWYGPVPDGRGSMVFSAPAIEIKVRWTDKAVAFVDASTSDEVISKAVVMVDRDAPVGCFLYLGELASLPVSHADPTLIDGAHRVRNFSKTPNLKATEFLRRAYL